MEVKTHIERSTSGDVDVNKNRNAFIKVDKNKITITFKSCPCHLMDDL